RHLLPRDRRGRAGRERDRRRAVGSCRSSRAVLVRRRVGGDRAGDAAAGGAQGRARIIGGMSSIARRGALVISCLVAACGRNRQPSPDASLDGAEPDAWAPDAPDTDATDTDAAATDAATDAATTDATDADVTDASDAPPDATAAIPDPAPGVDT